jgi:hypothetical protein
MVPFCYSLHKTVVILPCSDEMQLARVQYKFTQKRGGISKTTRAISRTVLCTSGVLPDIWRKVEMERRMGTRKQAVTMGQCWLGPGIEG